MSIERYAFRTIDALYVNVPFSALLIYEGLPTLRRISKSLADKTHLTDLLAKLNLKMSMASTDMMGQVYSIFNLSQFLWDTNDNDVINIISERN